ncbi:hypothetical protein EVAR_83827_1 [Eumeta japonica]|uniref:Uncharacterized protein n=1 Tax=Eumeta variegata TaxID=151549 RepID=A0A4C1WEV3_EUMVA|nr:hypothetical protein EVAR_83827_1 [Eumeta japonica]
MSVLDVTASDPDVQEQGGAGDARAGGREPRAPAHAHLGRPLTAIQINEIEPAAIYNKHHSEPPHAGRAEYPGETSHARPLSPEV